MKKLQLKERNNLCPKEKFAPKLPDDVYEKYVKNRRLEFFNSCKEFNRKLLNKNSMVPKDFYFCTQTDYPFLTFNENECQVHEEESAVPDGLLTIKDEGTFPCIILQAIRYFFIPQSSDEKLLVSIASDLIEFGYKKNSDSPLWATFDVLMPLKYGINTIVPNSVPCLLHALSNGSPVLALVPARWAQGENIPSNQAMIIWGIQNGYFICTDTFSKCAQTYKAIELLEHIKGVWILSI